MSKATVTEKPTTLNCGECLMERVDVVPLKNGVCPKCGADYRDVPAIARANRGGR